MILEFGSLEFGYVDPRRNVAADARFHGSMLPLAFGGHDAAK